MAKKDARETGSSTGSFPGDWFPALAQIAGCEDIKGFLTGFAALLGAAVPCDTIVLSCQLSAMAFENGVVSDDPVITHNVVGLTAQAVVMDVRENPATIAVSSVPWLASFGANRAWTHALVLWIPYRGHFGATAILYRRKDQQLFDASERRAVEALRPLCSKALERLLDGQQARALNKNLLGFLNDLPVGLVMLDWDASVVFVNREGYRQSLCWNYLPKSPPRNSDPEAEFAIPAEIYAACNEFRNRFIRTRRGSSLDDDATISVRHPQRADFRASITASRALEEAHEPPKLLVRFYGMVTRTENDFVPSAGQLKLLAQLTPTERAVTLLVLKGLSNREIADRLHREVSTIKDHLSHIFNKLAIRSRVQLVRMLA